MKVDYLLFLFEEEGWRLGGASEDYCHPVSVRESLPSSVLSVDVPDFDMNVSMCKPPGLSAASSVSERSWWGSSRSAAGSVESATCCGRWGGGVASLTLRRTAEEIELKEEEEGGWGLERQHDSGGRGKIYKNRITYFILLYFWKKIWDYARNMFK